MNAIEEEIESKKRAEESNLNLEFKKAVAQVIRGAFKVGWCFARGTIFIFHLQDDDTLFAITQQKLAFFVSCRDLEKIFPVRK